MDPEDNIPNETEREDHTGYAPPSDDLPEAGREDHPIPAWDGAEDRLFREPADQDAPWVMPEASGAAAGYAARRASYAREDHPVDVWQGDPAARPGDVYGNQFPVANSGSRDGHAVPPGAEASRPPAVYRDRAEQPPQKKNTAVIVLLAVIIILLIAFIILLFFWPGRYADNSLPGETMQTIHTREETTPVAETAPVDDPTEETASDESETEEAASGEPTTAAVATTAPAAENAELTDAQVRDVINKMLGYWTADDNTRGIGVIITDDGQCFFGYGWWASEWGMVGYLQKPVTGDPDGIVNIHLFYEGNDNEELSIPAQDEDQLFDLSRIDEGVIGWKHDGGWESFHYAGATTEDVERYRLQH